MSGTRIGAITTRKYALTADHEVVWTERHRHDRLISAITVPQHEDDDAVKSGPHVVRVSLRHRGSIRGGEGFQRSCNCSLFSGYLRFWVPRRRCSNSVGAASWQETADWPPRLPLCHCGKVRLQRVLHGSQPLHISLTVRAHATG